MERGARGHGQRDRVVRRLRRRRADRSRPLVRAGAPLPPRRSSGRRAGCRRGAAARGSPPTPGSAPAARTGAGSSPPASAAASSSQAPTGFGGSRRTRTGRLFTQGPTIDSIPGTSAGRPENAAPKVTSSSPLQWPRRRAHAPCTSVLSVTLRSRASARSASVASADRCRDSSPKGLGGARTVKGPSAGSIRVGPRKPARLSRQNASESGADSSTARPGSGGTGRPGPARGGSAGASRLVERGQVAEDERPRPPVHVQVMRAPDQLPLVLVEPHAGRGASGAAARGRSGARDRTRSSSSRRRSCSSGGRPRQSASFHSARTPRTTTCTGSAESIRDVGRAQDLVAREHVVPRGAQRSPG